MPRRYLSLREAESAVIAGKSVECFLGRCQRDAKDGVRWLAIHLSSDKNAVQVQRYDTSDLGTPDYVDLYEFGPLDPDLQLDEADETIKFSEFQALWAELEQRFPGSTVRLVNAGVVQEEYRAFKCQQ